MPITRSTAIATMSNAARMKPNVALTPERVKELRARIARGEKKTALARELGISRETLYQYAPIIHV